MLSTLPRSGNTDLAPAAAKPTQEEGQAALRLFFKLVPLWKVSEIEARSLLGEPARATYYRWRNGDYGAIPHDTLYRLGDIVGISIGLRHLFREPERGYEWLKLPNDAFAGRSALDVMLSGSPADLSRVRRYIDAEREGW
jgi:hypothetical protein